VRYQTTAALGCGLLVAVFLQLAPAGAEAHSLRGRGRRGPARLVDRLDLSAEQAREMRQLRSSHRKEQVRQRAALYVARLELADLLAAPKLDEAAIQAKAGEIGEKQAAQVRARVEHRLAVARILTPEQRERAQGMWGHGRGHGRGRGMAGLGPRRGSGCRHWSDGPAGEGDARPLDGGWGAE
jgi:Spy/CpxP family protein refolding chaperone